MGLRSQALSEEDIAFIGEQKMFFVATAAPTGRVNLSPKGLGGFHIVSPTQVRWLNVTGSGNETAAHLQENKRMTIMFCAFEGKPKILRLYGEASMLQPCDSEFAECLEHFDYIKGARQIFDLHIDLVQTSCGYGVPFYDYKEQRDILPKWSDRKGESGVRDYWAQNNMQSIDGRPTGIEAVL